MNRFRVSLTEADLCLFRVLYCGSVAIALAFTFPYYADMHREFFYSPTPLFRSIVSEAPPRLLFLSLGWVLLMALLTAALGVATRVSLAIAACSYFFFFGLQLGYTKPVDTGYVHHVKNLGVFILAILVVAPGVNRFTIFSLIRPRGARPPGRKLPPWPKILIIASLGAAYFGAGFTKIMKDPLWVDGHTVQAILLKQHLQHDLNLGLPIAEWHLLCLAMSLAVIAFELTFFLGVLVPRLRWLYIIGGIGMHLGFFLMVGANFLIYFAFTYLIFIEWRHVAKLLKLRADPSDIVDTSPPKTPRWILALATAFALAFFVTPILAKVEAWPLSDYRVFSGRTSPEEVEVLRFRAIDKLGQVQWLERRWQKELDRRFKRRLSSAIEIQDQARIDHLTGKAFSKLPKEMRKSLSGFELVSRKIQRSENGSGSWVPVDSVVVSLDTKRN